MNKIILLALTVGVITVAAWLASLSTSATQERVQQELGKLLFFDNHLSVNHTKSCATCHNPSMAFTDGYRTSVSAFGEPLKHNAPSLVYASKFNVLDWANPRVTTLQAQAQRPLFGTHPIEMGLHLHWREFEQYFLQQPLYKQLYATLFPDNKVDAQNLIRCLVKYVESLPQYTSRFDRYEQGNSKALQPHEQRGMQLFYSQRLRCSECHAGKHFTQAALTADPDTAYANIGLIPETRLAWQQPQGIETITHRLQDHGKYKIPSLRNVGVTEPYMHDGSLASLDDVISFYEQIGRSIEMPSTDSSRPVINTRSKKLASFHLTREEKHDLIAFLHTLTDSSFLKKTSGN